MKDKKPRGKRGRNVGAWVLPYAFCGWLQEKDHPEFFENPTDGQKLSRSKTGKYPPDELPVYL